MRFAIGLTGWLLATSLLALPVRIEVVYVESEPPSKPPDESVLGTLVIEAEGEPLTPREIRIPGEIVLDLPARTTSRLSLEADDLWAPDRVVIPSENSSNLVTFAVLPAGALQGKLTVQKGHAMPDRLDVFFQPSDPEYEQWKRLDQGSQAHQPCELGPEGDFTCPVPALTLDLHLHASGFVPRYFWGVAVAARETAQMGELSLRAGSSIVGRVVTKDGLPPEAGATVIVEPGIPNEKESARAEAKLDRRGRRGLVDRRGFFQLADIAPGSYRARIEKSGYASARSAPFTVYEGRETTLGEPLVLHPPVRFELVLEPAEDPYGRPWRVDFQPEGSHERQEQFVSEMGRWSRGDLTPGPYRLAIRSGTGRYGYSWWTGRVDVEPDMGPYHLEIPVLQVEGVVTLGDEPLEALVWFGGPHGGQQIRIDTNEDGFYAGYLPEEGLWRVTVEFEETGRRNLRPVEVEKAEGARAARVDLHLPDTRISGEVVDTEGNPVPAARVQALHLETGQDMDSTRSDADGEFELRGMAEGAVALSAHEPATGKSSSPIQVRLQEELEPPAIRLVLEKRQKLAGRVVWQGRPVPGARLSVLPKMPSGAAAFDILPTLHTDAEGRFSIRLPAQAVGADVTVLPPGFAVEIVTVSLPQDGFVDIGVSQEGGTLVLVTQEAEELLPGQPRRAALLQHDGAQVIARSLASWSLYHGVTQQPGQTTLPMMAPGSYSYCIPNSEPPPRCASGFLPPGGELTLQVKEESTPSR